MFSLLSCMRILLYMHCEILLSTRKQKTKEHKFFVLLCGSFFGARLLFRFLELEINDIRNRKRKEEKAEQRNRATNHNQKKETNKKASKNPPV